MPWHARLWCTTRVLWCEPVQDCRYEQEQLTRVKVIHVKGTDSATPEDRERYIFKPTFKPLWRTEKPSKVSPTDTTKVACRQRGKTEDLELFVGCQNCKLNELVLSDSMIVIHYSRIRDCKHDSTCVHITYDSGNSPGSAKQCILGILFLNQPFSKYHSISVHLRRHLDMFLL